MKYLAILLILIAGNVFAEIMDDSIPMLCDNCQYAFNFDFGFGFGSSPSPSTTYAIFQTGGTNTIYLTGTTTILEYTH